MKTPFDHQIAGRNYGTTRDGGGFIFSDPRTGKTFTMQLIEKSLNCEAVLVVAPATVLATWVGALLDEGVRQEDIVVFDGRYKGTIPQLRHLLVLPNKKWFIVNFEKLEGLDVFSSRKDIPKGCGISDWDLVIIDESVRIAKFDNNNTTKYVLSNPRPLYQRRFCLSGYPMTESAMDIACQALVVDGEYFGCTDFESYRWKYWTWVEKTYKWVPKSKLHLEAVQAWVKKNSFGVKLEDLGMGGKVLKNIWVLPPSDFHTTWLQWLASANAYKHPESGEICEMIPPVRTLFEQKVTAGMNPLTGEIVDLTKVQHITEYLKDTGQKALVLSRFRTPLHVLQSTAKEIGLKTEVITGDTSLQHREQIRQNFQDGKLNAVFAITSTVMMGQDYSSLDVILYYANDYSFNIRAQSQLRGQHVHRTTPYEVVDVCIQDTNDIRISHILNSKEEDADNYVPRMDEEMRKKWLGRTPNV